jgi:hypothetical protein
MAGAEAHGVTKTTPNATQRPGSARVMAALWLLYGCLKTGLSKLLRPLLLRWALLCDL